VSSVASIQGDPLQVDQQVMPGPEYFGLSRGKEAPNLCREIRD
jgi:hypothetical protein